MAHEPGDANELSGDLQPGSDGDQGAAELADTGGVEQPAGPSVLRQIGIDLTEIASQLEITLDGELWETELRRIKEILERRERHSGVLVGPDGVGKRALVLTLAREIAQGRVPRRLAGRRIIELPFHRVLASVREAGDFEKIVFTALREASARDDVILFLNGITSFMGVSAVGSQPGPFNASYLLEMGCHQPGLYLLGSTTPALYREVLRSLPWCQSLIHRVDVLEPSRESTVEILTDTAKGLEEFHGVRIDPGAVDAAVDLSDEYLRERVLPGKALELLDRAASRLATSAAGNDGTPTVGVDDVTDALADWTGIPTEKLSGGMHAELAGLEDGLRRRIRGQDACIKKLADVIRVTKLNLNAVPTRPDGVFLFVGPSGVGKTELARALAEELYGSESRLVTFNMTRYAGEDGLPRLVGMQLGDIEHEGDLTAAIAKHPHSVVAFEHIERSHVDVAVMLTQMFQDGHVADGHGTRLPLSNSTIILTSNSENIVPKRDDDGAVGFGAVNNHTSDRYLQQAKDAIEEFFPAEFMNGIDEVLLFDPLTEDALKEIVQIHLHSIRERLDRRSISLEVTDDTVAMMVKKGASREYGARNLGRTVEGLLLKPLARFLVSNADARTVVARVVEGDVEVLATNGGQ